MHQVGISQDIVDRVTERRGRFHLYDTIAPARSAFVVVDMQNAFVEPGAPAEVPASRGIVPGINRLAGALRPRGCVVVWITSVFRTTGGKSDWENFFNHIVAAEVRERTMSYMAPGSAGVALWSEMEVADGDLHIAKNRYSCLAPGASALERTLRSRGVDTILVGGTKTNVCCETMARDAFDMDFNVVMVSDCCAALSDREHQATLESIIQQFGDVMTADEVLERLED